MEGKPGTNTVKRINSRPNFKEWVDCSVRCSRQAEEDKVLEKRLQSGNGEVIFNFVGNCFFVCGDVSGGVEGFKQIVVEG